MLLIIDKAGGYEMNITTLGTDLAMNVFHVHGEDARGKFIIRKRLNRKKRRGILANLSP